MLPLTLCNCEEIWRGRSKLRTPQFRDIPPWVCKKAPKLDVFAPGARSSKLVSDACAMPHYATTSASAGQCDQCSQWFFYYPYIHPLLDYPSSMILTSKEG